LIDSGRVGVAAQHGAVANEAVLAALKHFQQGMKALRQASKATQEVTGALADNNQDSEVGIDKAALKAFVQEHKHEIKSRVMKACPALKHCPREGFNLEARKMYLESVASTADGVSTTSTVEVTADMDVDAKNPSPSVSSQGSRKRNWPSDQSPGERFPLLQALFLKGT
jgi:hypothetical protein